MADYNPDLIALNHTTIFNNVLVAIAMQAARAQLTERGWSISAEGLKLSINGESAGYPAESVTVTLTAERDLGEKPEHSVKDFFRPYELMRVDVFLSAEGWRVITT